MSPARLLLPTLALLAGACASTGTTTTVAAATTTAAPPATSAVADTTTTTTTSSTTTTTTITRPPRGDAPTGRIAFVSDRSGNNDIFLVDADGSNLMQLTFDESDDHSPRWFDDGRRIAFVSNRTSGSNPANYFGGQGYVIDADGSNLATEPSGSTKVFNFDPSPDGRRFIIDRIDGTFVVDSATGEELGRVGAVVYDWAPDGRSALTTTKRAGSGLSAAILDTASLDHTIVAASEEEDRFASFSPDASMIVLERSQSEFPFTAIKIIPVDGGEPIDISPELFGAGYADRPMWSPHDDLIAFEAGFPADIFVMRPDGSGVERLTDGQHWETLAGWSPDGHWILYIATEESGRNLRVVTPDGSIDLLVVEDVSPIEDFPAWKPGS